MAARLQEHYSAVIDSPVGRLGIRVEQDALTAIDFVGAGKTRKTADTAAARAVVSALQTYFRDGAWGPADLPLAPEGTVFQKKVWRALRRIPDGKTLSYGELARRVGSSARAVGNACRANPIPILIPCHRVVSVSGMGGYMGATAGRRLDIKRRLLELEAP